MPVYEFQCETCGEVFEVSRPMRQASDPAPCPKDGGASHRVFNAEAIHRSGFRERHALRRDPGAPDEDGTSSG